MGLTPRGPRPLASPSPSSFGAPAARQVRRGTRDIARGRYGPMASTWLESLKHSKRSGENAQTWLYGADSAIIAVLWTVACYGAGSRCTVGTADRRMSWSICAAACVAADPSSLRRRRICQRSNSGRAMRPNGRNWWRGSAIGHLASRIGDQARFACGLAAARAGLRPPPRPLVPRPISLAKTRRRSA